MMERTGRVEAAMSRLGKARLEWMLNRMMSQRSGGEVGEAEEVKCELLADNGGQGGDNLLVHGLGYGGYVVISD